MPTFALINHKVVTNFGETFLKTKESANDGDINEWIKQNQGAINGAFATQSGGAAVKVLAIYIVRGDGTETKL
jgi:hypothetical protein